MEILKISHELIVDDILEQDITVALEFTAMDGKISLEHHPVLLLTSVLIWDACSGTEATGMPETGIQLMTGF